MTNDYKVHRKRIKEADDFEVLILEIPRADLEDKLAYLAREKGQISKVFYDDFIIATCVANINQLLFSLNNHGATQADLVKVREEVVKNIIEANPLLNPDELVINRNHVVKIKEDDTELEEGTKLLNENKYWDSSSYYDNQPEGPPTDLTQPTDRTPSNTGKQDSDDKNKELKDVNSLEFEVVQKWWKRIGQYVQVKTFNENDAESILKHRYFHNRTSFGTFIVSICIQDFDELFALLDNMGVPTRVAPPLLIHELYELCLECNGFLTFERAQELADVDDDDSTKKSCSPGAKKCSSSSGTMGQYMNKKKQKLFKDLPKEDLLKLGDNIKVLLVGQDKAVDSLSEAIQRASVGLKDPHRPIGSFLFAGRTGVGKTLATKILADELIKGKDNIVTIDCSEYSADHEYAKLIGAPSGYVGHEAGGFLTNAIAKNPFNVVVFDEVEKASKKVHELLLQILEEGRLTDGKGKTVSFKDTVIILTSNVGVSEIDKVKKTIGFGNANILTEEKKEAALNDALKKKFKPEFLNRIDEIVHFNTLSRKDYMRIIDIELYKLNDNLRHNDTEYKEVELRFDKKVKSLIFKDGIDEEYGARPLKRCIERKISTPLAKRLLTEKVGADTLVIITTDKSKVSFDLSKKPVDPPFYISDKAQEAAAGCKKGDDCCGGNGDGECCGGDDSEECKCK